MNIQGSFSSGLTGLISLQSKGLSRIFFSTTILKHQFFSAQSSLWYNSHIHPYITSEKTTALTVWAFAGKVMSLLLTMLSRFVTAFPPRNKCVLISWLQSLSIVILDSKKRESGTVFNFFPICHEVMRPVMRCHDLRFVENWVLNQLFHSPLSPSSRGSLVPLHFLPLKWYHLHISGCWYFSKQQMDKEWVRETYFTKRAWWCFSCVQLFWSHGVIPPGSSVHGIFQAKTLEWAAISLSRGSFWPRDQPGDFCTAGSPVQSLSHVQLFMTPWTAVLQASLSIINSWSLLTLMSIESVMPSNHLILCHLLLLPPSIFPSIRVFSNESRLCIRWPKYWSSSISITPSNEYSGLISFKMDWLDLLAVQGTLKSLLQHHNLKA